MRLKTTICTLALALSLSGCALGIKTLKVDVGKAENPIITMNLKLDGFNTDSLYHSLGIWSKKFGPLLDRDDNGYLDPGDFVKSYRFMTDGKIQEEVRRYFDEKPERDTSRIKIHYRFARP